MSRGKGNSDSPPPSLNLADCGSKDTIDGQLYGELVRAGMVVLAENHQHINKINVRTPLSSAVLQTPRDVLYALLPLQPPAAL